MAIVGDAFGKPMVRALEEAETDNAPYDLASLGLIISSGVMWTAEVKQALMARGQFICLDSLGSSEGVGFAQQISAPGMEATTAKFSIGGHAKVLTEDGREVEPGSDERGLLALGGPIPLGYYKDPDKSAATFRTFDGKRYSIPGDWAKVAADGTIELLGRGSVSINSGGEKIFPEEVEEAVKLHPAVADAIVVGVPDEKFGEAITALVSLRPGEEATAAEIVGVVRESISTFKAPRHVVFVDEVTRGPNGKADYAWAKNVAVREGQLITSRTGRIWRRVSRPDQPRCATSGRCEGSGLSGRRSRRSRDSRGRSPWLGTCRHGRCTPRPPPRPC